jgi:hypothetical protein
LHEVVGRNLGPDHLEITVGIEVKLLTHGRSRTTTLSNHDSGESV